MYNGNPFPLEVIGNILSFISIDRIKDIAVLSDCLPKIILKHFTFNPKIENKPGKSGCAGMCHHIVSIPLFDSIIGNNRDNLISLFKNVHQKLCILNYCLLKGAHTRALKILKSSPDLADNKTMYYAAKGNLKDVVSFLFTLERFKNNKIGNIVLYISVSNSYSDIVAMVLGYDFLDLEKGRKDLLKPDLNIKFPVDFLNIALHNLNKKIEELIVDYCSKKCPSILLLSINTRIPSLYALEKGYVHITSKERVDSVMSMLVAHYSQNDILRYLKEVMQNGMLIGDCTKAPTRIPQRETEDDLPTSINISLRVIEGEIVGMTDLSALWVMDIISKENLEHCQYKPSENVLQSSIRHFRYKIIEYLLLKSEVPYNGLGVVDVVNSMSISKILNRLDDKTVKNATKCIKVLLKDDRTNLKHDDYLAIKNLIRLNLVDVIELIVRDDRIAEEDLQGILKGGLGNTTLVRFLSDDITKDTFIKGLRTWSLCYKLGSKIIKGLNK